MAASQLTTPPQRACQHEGGRGPPPGRATSCTRLGLPLPDAFPVLDALPLACVLLPTLPAHTVGALAAHYGCARPDAHLAEEGFPVPRQGQGSLRLLVDEFRDDPARSLLGSRSLWEGVDVAGPSLSYVFLEKLPYPSIGDPVEAARMGAVEASGGDPFRQYLLPKMVTVLKQGFGRLIRSPHDHGAAILLDKRLRGAMYRMEVLRSLPDLTVGYESGADMFRRIAEWMDLPFDPSEIPMPAVPDLMRLAAPTSGRRARRAGLLGHGRWSTPRRSPRSAAASASPTAARSRPSWATRPRDSLSPI